MISFLPALDCGKLDVVFALDSSESVGNENWIKVRQLLVNVIDSLNFTPEGARVRFENYVTVARPFLLYIVLGILNVVCH